MVVDPDVGTRPLAAVVYAYNHTTHEFRSPQIVSRLVCLESIDLGWFEYTDAIQKCVPASATGDFAPDVVFSFAKNLKWRHRRSNNPFAGDMPEEYKDKEDPGLQE
ncbi:hypothetical protein HO173_008309 [Letharia columbiana]|uniref:Uncharacterized protein n=1 Tax=Letharia columbiana TaxID=112416 RepID=A0A8H6FRH8_9LECA|nr:uncharacterized protein HO173_008309 [Letharia columbiana]KAF6233377.1 hypothetical protein HO173_008309 [Letharia columbiana]